MPTVRPRARDLLARGGVLIIGHRGACAHAPENTLPSLRAAVEAGADLVELDTRETKDAVPVVLHDATLDRTTDALARWGGAPVRVAERTLTEIGTLDAGAWWHPRFRGAHVPTLEAALDTIGSGSMALIERKAGGVDTLLEVLARADLLEHVVVQSFDEAFVAACGRAHPELLLGVLGSKVLTEERLAGIARTGARVVVWKHTDVDAAMVRRVHASGLALWVYTVNDLSRARDLAALGVSGIITDDPAALRRALPR